MDFDDHDESSLWKPEDGDWLLAKMVSVLNEEGGAMEVTLTVGGTLITGEMIGGAEYFGLIGEAFADTKGRFSEFGAQLYSSDDVNPTPAFLHMKNAVVLSADRGAAAGKNGMLWRGRIAAVDGFAWGRFTARDSGDGAST